jgi:hypothetical protein
MVAPSLVRDSLNSTPELCVGCHAVFAGEPKLVLPCLGEVRVLQPEGSASGTNEDELRAENNSSDGVTTLVDEAHFNR